MADMFYDDTEDKNEFVFSKKEVNMIVHHYRNEPVLWDSSNANYAKKAVRNVAIQRIAEALDNKFTAHEINMKITHMRSYYTKELRKIRNSPADEKYRSKWPYFNAMDHFLRPQIQVRKPVTTVQMDSVSLDSQDDDDYNEDDQSVGDSNLEQPRIDHPKRRKISETTPSRTVYSTPITLPEPTPVKLHEPTPVRLHESTALRTNASRRPATVSKGQNEDDEIHFVRYLASEIRKIKDVKIKNMTKLKLQSLVFEAQTLDTQRQNFEQNVGVFSNTPQRRTNNYNQEQHTVKLEADYSDYPSYSNEPSPSDQGSNEGAFTGFEIRHEIIQESEG